MDLYTYSQYAIVTGFVALIVIVIALSIKSWFDARTFVENLMLKRQFDQMDYELMIERAAKTFDEHVRSTPGMHTLN